MSYTLHMVNICKVLAVASVRLINYVEHCLRLSMHLELAHCEGARRLNTSNIEKTVNLVK